MGEKRKRQRQHVLSFLALCMMAMAWITGCFRMPVRPAIVHDDGASIPCNEVVPAETVEPKAEPVPDEVACPLLDQAESYLKNGEYAEAMDAVEKAMDDCGYENAALFRRALAITIDAAASMTPSKGGTDGLSCLSGLGSPMPDNGPAAQCWLAILNELSDLKMEAQRLKAADAFQKKRITALKDQLEQLKAVDLELGTPDTDEDSHE